MAMYRCKKCGFLYIDDKNDKPFAECEEGSFKCPRCRCSKKMFEKVESA